MKYLKSIFASVDWWRLRPCPELLRFQPGSESPARFVSAACSEERDLAMVYSPEGGSIQLNAGFLSGDVTMQCFNPENGKLLWQRRLTENEKRIEETIDTGSPGDRVLVLRASSHAS
jgi:hypothetical protein